MMGLVIANSLPTTSIQAASPLEEKVEYMDEDGVIRRSNTITKRMLMRGTSVGKLEYLFTATHTTEEKEDISQEEQMLAQKHQDERKHHRRALIKEIKERKHNLLVRQNSKHEERLQQWYAANENDSEVETTPAHTLECPSPKSRAFVDHEGNIRRIDDSENGSGATPSSPRSPSKDPKSKEVSLLWEFVQAIVDGCCRMQEHGSTRVCPSVDYQAAYHVRVTHAWPATSQYSFFGMELELHGVTSSKTTNQVDRLPTVAQLQFGNPEITANTLDQLSTIVGPFRIRVSAKMTVEMAATELQKFVLQQIVTVQEENFLVDINNIHFLKSCLTGKDVFEHLMRVLTKISVAKPFEFRFERHNHALASAKIIPFAVRQDVQVAQIAQFKKMQQQEQTENEAIKRKKQFILQQLDFEREHYLYDHIGMQLHHLHEEIMKDGQWQAYEFSKVLWYYHVTTNLLYAEHPMRNNTQTRQIIGSAQFRTRFAARKLQRGIRVMFRRKKLTERAVDDCLMETILTNLWQEAWNGIWLREISPFYWSIASQLSSNAQNLDEQAQELWIRWINHRSTLREGHPPSEHQTSESFAAVSTHIDVGIQTKDGQEVAAENDAIMTTQKSEISTTAVTLDPSSTISAITTTHEKTSVQATDTTRFLISSPESNVLTSATTGNVQKTITKAEDNVVAFVTSISTNIAHEPVSRQTTDSNYLSVSARECDSASPAHIDNAKTSNAVRKIIDPEDMDRGDWKQYLTLLRANLQHKKTSVKHRRKPQVLNQPSIFNNQQTKHGLSPPHLAKNSTRMSSTIVHQNEPSLVPSFPIEERDFQLHDQRQPLPFVSPPSMHVGTGSPMKESRSLPAPLTLKASDSLEDIGTLYRGGSYRTFHSFFASNFQDNTDPEETGFVHQGRSPDFDRKYDPTVLVQKRQQYNHQNQQQQPHVNMAGSSLPDRIPNYSDMEIPKQNIGGGTAMQTSLTRSPAKLPYIMRRKNKCK